MSALRPTSVLLALGLATASQPAAASSSSPAAASPMAGNGHNVTFDGRVFIVSQGPLDPSGGWFMMVFRPELTRYAAGGVLDLMQGAFTAPVQVQPSMNTENALAICEVDAANTPYACDDAGNPGGPYACYDLHVIDSDALSNPKDLRRRTLKLWLQAPGTQDAAYYKHTWIGGMEPVFNGANNVMRGIEPTVTRDGKLLVWQGHPANDGQIDILMYATNPSPCAATGWDGPHNLSHLYVDPNIAGVYALGERQLRTADGTPFADGTLVHGAYPWLFPDGDALSFTATPMPCMSPENPPGCGPRRNTLSVLGYPTNWGIAPIDGGLNPSTTDNVRLFFSSPGRDAFPQLPLTGGVDVWPLFGSNTANQADVVFDDGLDGNYAGVWHMNESVDINGNLDKGRSPDTSGYFNTGIVHGAPFTDANNGIFGKALQLDGQTTWVEVPSSESLTPSNAFSAELWVYPYGPVDCDANNNYRLLMSMGNIGGPFAVILEDGEVVRLRVHAGGMERDAIADRALPITAWSHVGGSYDGATGQLRLHIDGVLAGSHDGPPAPLDASVAPLMIGGPGGDRPACPTNDGNFHGAIDEVKLSRNVRDLTFAPRPGNHVALRRSDRAAAGRGRSAVPGQLPLPQPRHHRVGARHAAPPRLPGADGQRHLGHRPRRARRQDPTLGDRHDHRRPRRPRRARQLSHAMEAGPRRRGVVRRAQQRTRHRGRPGRHPHHRRRHDHQRRHRHAHQRQPRRGRRLRNRRHPDRERRRPDRQRWRYRGHRRHRWHWRHGRHRRHGSGSRRRRGRLRLRPVHRPASVPEPGRPHRPGPPHPPTPPLIRS